MNTLPWWDRNTVMSEKISETGPDTVWPWGVFKERLVDRIYRGRIDTSVMYANLSETFDPQDA